jgi:hypothetical protein
LLPPGVSIELASKLDISRKPFGEWIIAESKANLDVLRIPGEVHSSRWVAFSVGEILAANGVSSILYSSTQTPSLTLKPDFFTPF